MAIHIDNEFRSTVKIINLQQVNRYILTRILFTLLNNRHLMHIHFRSSNIMEINLTSEQRLRRLDDCNDRSSR
jgi:hypothetical protein